MPDFDIDKESIVVFHIGDEYLFSHYFDRQDIFTAPQEYYQDENYRFEVPEDDFESVQQRLEDAYYKLTVVGELEPYCVVIDKYDEHAEILRESVATWERRGQRFFLMKNELAVKEAIERGADRLTETEFVLGL